MHLSTGTPRHVKNRERKGPPQGVIQQSELHKCSPHAPKFEDRTQEETLQQERCTRKDACEMTKSVHKLKEKDKATLYSLSDVWCPPAPSSSKPEERQFVVDFGASMHMLSRKDLNLAELETVRVSRNPTTVITANGEVQTHVEASVYVTTWSYSSRYKSSRTCLRSCRWENTVKITDIHMSGPVAKNRISLKTAGKYNATRKITSLSLFPVGQPDPPVRVQVRLLHRYRRTSLMILRQVHDVEVQALRYLETSCEILQKPKNATKMKDTVPVQGDLLRDLPEWLREVHR